MKIGFDAKRLYNNFTGLGNYSRFIVRSLREFYPENKYFLFTPKIKVNDDTKPFIEAGDLQTILPPAWISRLKLGSFWRSLYLGHEAEKQGISIYHGLSHELPSGIPSDIKAIVTIHDLIFLRFPQFYNRIDVAIYTSKINYACKRADRIIAISEQTKQDIIDFLKVDPNKISVVYQGCHPNFNKEFSSTALAEIKRKYALPDEFILTVGTIEPRKNVLLIFKAMALLKDNVSTQLVVVGRPTAYLEELKAYALNNNIESRIIYLHKTEFADLPDIYSLAKLFIYPSLFEGFGIPLVEAIACNVPVISSKGSCFSEAAGPDSIYVDPNDDHELAEQIEKVLGNEELRLKMISASKTYIQKFKPVVIAKQIHQVYESVLH